jgi:hypothetical protein
MESKFSVNTDLHLEQKWQQNVSIDSPPLLDFLIPMMDGARMLGGLGSSKSGSIHGSRFHSNLNELCHRYNSSHCQPMPRCLLQTNLPGWVVSISPAPLCSLWLILTISLQFTQPGNQPPWPISHPKFTITSYGFSSLMLPSVFWVVL